MNCFFGVGSLVNIESDFMRSAAVSAGASNSCIFSRLANFKLSTTNESFTISLGLVNESLGTPILRWRAICACMLIFAASTKMRSSKRSRRYVNVFVFNVVLVFWLLQRVKNFHNVFQLFFVVEGYTDFSFTFGGT